MIKELKVGKKIFMAQTTYYIYNSKKNLQEGRPALTTSDKSVFESYLRKILGDSIKNVMSKLKKRKVQKSKKSSKPTKI